MSVIGGRRHRQGHWPDLLKGTGWSVARILVVDDEPDARYLLRHAFERAGHVVSEAAHGLSALAAIAVSAQDLVVTDMMMPVMGGVDLIRTLRADPRTADIPIVCVSGNHDLAIGADLSFDKYGDLTDLVARTEALLNEGRDPR